MRIWHRFNGRGKRHVGLAESVKVIVFSSWMNVMLLFIPFAWISHFLKWNDGVTFALCFMAIIPLEKLFDWGGEQMLVYLGISLGDLLIVTLNNAVEATLAIILLANCELRILQATIIGVVLLHLLLIPGTAFLIGGSSVWEQHLHPHSTQLNNSLLTVGVLSILIPTAFFSAVDRGITPGAENIITDEFRGQFLLMSRGSAVILLVIYVASRVFIANPPGEDNAGKLHPSAPSALHDEERELEEREPEVNSWVCTVMLVICIALMGVTAEFLVESIEVIREEGHIREEWFGLILLPLVSFSADGALAIVFFARSLFRRVFGYAAPEIPSELARARAIDLSIQFTLFWMPFLVLLAWWIGSPLSLLFDLYEVALIIGSTFLVNYITADAKTNWVEGLIMIGFYTMIALWTWFYVGQPTQEVMLAGPGRGCAAGSSIAEAISALGAEAGGEGGGAGEVVEHVARALFS